MPDSERDSAADGPDAERVAIVACDVFEDALRRFAARNADGRDLDLRFLDIRYHSDYDGMEDAIRETTERARAAGADRVLVGYGAVCHPEMERIVAESDAELLPTINCIDAFAGAEAHAEVFRDDLLFVTPGWLEKLLPSARADPDRFAGLDRIVFQNPVDVDRAANDSDGAPVEDRLAELAEVTGLPVERREGDPDAFAELLRDALAE